MFNDLQEFAPEGSPQGNEASISLHDLLARGTAVHWDEAVAIVQEMCDVLIASSGDGASVPDLADVLISKSGTVSLRRNRGEKSPSAAGRTLHSLLANADVPMSLRLFVTRSTAPETYGSLREFAAGLAYFGKPDRTQLIRDVYVRGSEGTPSEAQATAGSPPLRSADIDTAKVSPDAKVFRRRRLLRRALAGASLCLAGGAAWMWTSGGSRTEIQGSAAQAISRAAAALSDLGQQVRDTLATPTAAPAAEASGDSPAKSSLPGRRSSSCVARWFARDKAVEPLVSRRVSTAPGRALQLAAAIPHSVVPALAEFAEEPTERGSDAPLYSTDDSDVQPPLLLYPQLTPLPAAPGTRAESVNRMAVIVSPDGSVEPCNWSTDRLGCRT